ncbi:TPA: DUF2188 domain-containing protein [Staphylococcus aureus]|uniref:DUF2188 domain-containing protein n=1 Tax=Staphylococcus TaxID=1279 RepID=UPI00024322B2|nr:MULTISPECIES: DUF2188 domain-containing protein [Staphylococcus]ARR27167.1 hypothetical protein FORC39_2356 [Staphylococcus aureus]AVP11976.1 hypothetical protein FORC59_2320 [Staphylococcus aureus]EHM84845.1 hypothetical protein SA21340_0529 [Staphylococcus aureus subsp. aureus 21340]EJB8508966.1 DUF2188 domain-containing protein [Staphylococcus aureus]EJX2072996.1 DUF2188 domain-containing protein [Staphylococcus aureus]
MPCTLKGYPEKWKEFETLKREKAIEIANAMLREGYLEKDVIPIATKKAKDWYRTLSKEEIKALEEENIVQFHTATMEKTEVDSEDATTDNEKRIQEVSNQNKSKFNIEPNESESSGVRQRESIIDGPHAKAVGSFKDL